MTRQRNGQRADISPSARPPAAAIAGGWERVWAGVLALGCLSLLVTAAVLEPSARGVGTHQQLGMSACMWESAFDKPCATCGMTTSFAYAADGSFRAAFVTQPAGAALSLLAAMGFWMAAHVAATGSRVGALVAHTINGWTIGFGLLAVGAAWAYKLTTWAG